MHPTVVGRPCSVAAALEVVGDRWSLLAVREVNFGNHRFSEIARNTGAPRDRLSARLHALVVAGVLERREYQSSPSRADYHLTDAGRDLIPVLQALREWGDKWAVDEPPMLLFHDDHRVVAETICATCGEPLEPGGTRRVSNVAGWDLSGPVA